MNTIYKLDVTVPDRGCSWDITIGYFSSEKLAKDYLKEYEKQVSILSSRIEQIVVVR